MIVIQNERPYSIHYRTSRRTRRRYAEYAGRYASPGDAIEELRRSLDGQPAEYLITCLATDEEVIGTISRSVTPGLCPVVMRANRHG